MALFRYGYVRPPRPADTFVGLLLDASSNSLRFANRIYPSKTNYVDSRIVSEPGDIAVWFLFKHEEYDIARVYSSDGDFRGYYVDITEPIQWDGSNVDRLQPIVDLFLDIWIWPDMSFAILDADELDEAADRSWVSTDQAVRARRTILRLTDAIDRTGFPPDEVRAFELTAELKQEIERHDFRNKTASGSSEGDASK